MSTQELGKSEIFDEKIGEELYLNIGPSHPATHGTFRFRVALDGEVITKAKVEIGYLHRCFEKMAETHPWQQVIPYTDRLNYCSSFMNNVGYCIAVEKLIGMEAPERAQCVRIILSEFSRLMDHFTVVGPALVDIGALTNFWYLFRGREEIYDLLESCCGARLTVSYCRIGGLQEDIPATFVDHARALLKSLPKYIKDVDGLVTKNRIFLDRTKGVGVLSAAEAIEWGWTGPCLRASGVNYDIRKVYPYIGYDQYDFEVPLGENGDAFDRYMVRMKEMWQSMRIIDQALKKLPGGRWITDNPAYALPPKQEVYSNIEALMDHFKLIMHGMKPPKGEVYSYTEAANGELGFYVVSDGGPNPYRIKVRPPCYAIYQGFEKMLVGLRISDIFAILPGLNIIAGELDR
jgi:NADH-quinone oxidoreductase subunit C/D